MAYRTRRPARRTTVRRRRTYTRRAAPRRRVARTYTARRSRRPVMQSAQQTPIGGKTPRYIKALINPFDKDVYGVRIPDTSTSPSSAIYTYDTRSMIVVDVNAAARSALFVPNAGQYSYDLTSTGPDATTIKASFSGAVAVAKTAAIQAAYTLARPVAHGVRITCGTGATTTAGFVHVALVPLSMSASTWKNLPLNTAQMSSMATYRRVTLSSLTANPLVVVNRYNDSTAYKYTDTGNAEAVTDGTGQTFHSWMGIMVMITGHGLNIGGELVSIENLCHFEVQAKNDGISSDGMGEPSNPAVLEAAANAASQSNANFIEGTYDEEQHYKQCLNNAGRRYQQISGAGGGHGLPGISNAGRLG